MEGDIGDLLHLGDLASLEDTSTAAFSVIGAECYLSQMKAADTEIGWCLGRIAEHRAHIRRLRDVYGPAAHNVIWETKACIRALRFEYNAWAPINRYLPPEVLMEVFANVHPAMTPQRRVPVLRVCRYWRRLVLKTPHFWANVLSLPILKRFTAALSLSAPRSLTLSLPFWSLDIVDALLPHAGRIASLTLRLGSGLEYTQQLLERRLSRLRRLIILDDWVTWDEPLTLYFHQYPDIRSLRLDITLFYSSVVPCASLLHLKLTHCVIRTQDTKSYIPSLRALHDALELFPNLETLSLTYSLSEGHPSGNPPELTKNVHLPRLRRVEIEDIPVYIPRFLSHLAFPSTTILILQPAYQLATERPVTAPVFPGINPTSPTPANAGLSLYLDFSTSVPPQHHSKGIARWETRGGGPHPVRVTLPGAAHALATIAHFTRELVRTLAPAPSRGVTVLTVGGTWAQRDAGELHLSAREYWTAFLPNLAGLRRLVCTTDRATRDLVDVLGRPLPRRGGALEFTFPCPGLADLALVWDLRGADGPCLEPFVEGGRCDEGTREHAGRLSRKVVAALVALCGTLGACLAARAGRCERIRRLSVALGGVCGESTDGQGWEGALKLVEKQLREGLGPLVGEVAVVDRVN
ncbi:hypothetical protein V8D89_016092 [Ganoderma adspersum]